MGTWDPVCTAGKQVEPPAPAGVLQGELEEQAQVGRPSGGFQGAGRLRGLGAPPEPPWGKAGVGLGQLKWKQPVMG